MRLFYAVEFDEKTRDILVSKQNLLKSRAVRANFTMRENLHLTLRFLGEVPSSDLPVLTGIQDLVSKRHGPFKIEISGLGTFVREKGGIVWAGIKYSEALLAFQRDLEKEIAKKGFRPENRPFKPHITLAREFIPDGSMDKTIKESGDLQHEFEVKSISLMESSRVNGKLVYTCLYNTSISNRK